jgi:hypothetical protein
MNTANEIIIKRADIKDAAEILTLQKLGYKPYASEPANDNLTIVYLEKPNKK